MSPITAFAWGTFGSLAVEIVLAYEAYAKPPHRLPARYKVPLFWYIRALLALTAGGLTAAYDISQPLLALHIGAATPLIIKALTQTIPTPAEPLKTVPANISSSRPADTEQPVGDPPPEGGD